MRSATIGIALLMAASAAAQDAGGTPWQGTDGYPKAALADAARDNRPMLLFFFTAGSSDSRKALEGLSSPDVAKAAGPLACIQFDCSNGQYGDVAAKYGVKAFPTALLCDGTGNPVEPIRSGNGAAIAAQVRAFVAKAKLSPAAEAVSQIPADYDLTPLRNRARKLGRLMGLYFFDSSPAGMTVEEAVNDPLVVIMLRRFFILRVPFQRGSGFADRFKVNRAPAFIIMDPRQEKPEEHILDTIVGSRDARELKRDLEAILTSHGGAAEPDAKNPSDLGGPSNLPEEKLSDDELERKFIEARVAVARDLMQQGMKSKAIEILEDVIKTYPKHVYIQQVKKILEGLKK